MNCFIFNSNSSAYDKICGTTVFSDLVAHLRNSGVTKIFCETERGLPAAAETEVCSFQDAQPKLGSKWLAVYDGIITRQSPAELRDLTIDSGADIGISLACSAKPWDHTTVLTDGSGFVEKVEKNPSPENLETNLCFSGFAWVGTDSFNPEKPVENMEKTAAFLLPGYWKRQACKEDYLLTVHDVLSRRVLPWPHLSVPDSGILLGSPVPESTEIRGTLWVGENCRIGNNCILENCVIMDNSITGAHSNLRNCLVSAATEIPPGTVQYDKYLSFFTGDDYGREY